MDSTSSALSATRRIELVRLPRRSSDRWPLLSPYVDLVWSEVLGVTAVAVARRLGHLLTTTPPTRGISLDSLATPLRISPSKTLDTLRRLHHHGLVEFREHAAVVGISGLAPDVPAPVAGELSSYTTRLRAQLDVGEPPPARSAGEVCAALRASGLER